MKTRFEQEISGELDIEVAERRNEENKWFWKKSAEKELDRVYQMIIKGEMLINNGIATWKSNGRCIMSDTAEKVEYLQNQGRISGFDRQATKEARNIQVDEELSEYRRNYKGPSAEELAEMRSAFGKGEVVVDVITGQRICL